MPTTGEGGAGIIGGAVPSRQWPGLQSVPVEASSSQTAMGPESLQPLVSPEAALQHSRTSPDLRSETSQTSRTGRGREPHAGSTIRLSTRSAAQAVLVRGHARACQCDPSEERRYPHQVMSPEDPIRSLRLAVHGPKVLWRSSITLCPPRRSHPRDGPRPMTTRARASPGRWRRCDRRTDRERWRGGPSRRL